MNRQSYEKLAVAFLLMLFIFVLGNLIFNIENLDLGGENLPEFVPPSEEAQNVATNQTVTRALLWIYYGFVGFCVLVVIIGAISFTRSEDRKKWRKLFNQMLALLLVIAAIFAFGYFYEDIESSVMGGGSTSILSGANGNVSTPGNASTPVEPPDSVSALLTFGMFAIVFLFCIVVFIAFNSLLKMRSSNLDYSDLEKDKMEVAHTIQRTIDALAGGSDTRATVIRCYTDMCRVMAKYGVQEMEHLTPREFQKLAIANLPVPEEQMSALVLVFEEARYSNHELGRDSSSRAVAALEAVRSKLMEAMPEKVQPGGETNG